MKKTLSIIALAFFAFAAKAQQITWAQRDTCYQCDYYKGEDVDMRNPAAYGPMSFFVQGDCLNLSIFRTWDAPENQIWVRVPCPPCYISCGSRGECKCYKLIKAPKIETATLPTKKVEVLYSGSNWKY